MSSFGSKNNSHSASGAGRPSNWYPSPFFDIAGTYMPTSIKDTFDWTLYYYQTNGIIYSIIHKLATYAITDLFFTHENEAVNKEYSELMQDDMGMKQFLIAMNLDRYVYGNGFGTVSLPFNKTYHCRGCKTPVLAERATATWRDCRPILECKTCAHSGEARVVDEPVKAKGRIKLIRWPPKSIKIKHSLITNRSSYFYTIPKKLRNDILMGDPETILNHPQAFIDAVREKKDIKLDSSKMFHMSRQGASRGEGDDNCWGMPLILPVLKEMFFMQVLKKSQEAVAMDHIVPMRIIHPQTSVDGTSPYATVNLQSWKKDWSKQLTSWKKDPNNIAVSTLPIGQQVLGGQGKAYLLHQEIRIYSEQIISSLGVPVGFFYGEVGYSGGSVNLKALENEFMSDRDDMLRLVKFVGKQIALFMDWPIVGMAFKPFKMADDLQRAAFGLQMMSQGVISQKEYSNTMSIEYEEQQEQLKVEAGSKRKLQIEAAEGEAHAQGRALMIQTSYNIKAEQLLRANNLSPEQKQIEMGQAQQDQQMQAQQQQGEMQQGQQEQQAQQQKEQFSQQQAQDQHKLNVEQQSAGIKQQDREHALTTKQSTDAHKESVQVKKDDRAAAKSGNRAKPKAKSSPRTKAHSEGSGKIEDSEELLKQAPQIAEALMKLEEDDRFKYLKEIKEKAPALFVEVDRLLRKQGVKTGNKLRG